MRARILRLRVRPTFVVPSELSIIPVTLLLPRFDECLVFSGLTTRFAGTGSCRQTSTTTDSIPFSTFGKIEEKNRSSAYLVYLHCDCADMVVNCSSIS